MKVCSLPHLFLAIFLAAAVSASILTEAKHPSSDRWLKLKEDVFGILEKEIATKAGAYKITVNKDSCAPYNPKDEASRLSVCVQTYDEGTNTISLQFRSPNNHFELEFSNIDVNDAANDIKIEPYLQEYIDSLKDLALDDATRRASIEEGIKAAATELGIADLAITADKFTYTYQNKQNNVSFKVTGDLLEFSTDFFQDTIDLNIPLKRFIVFEVKKMTREIIDHLYQMQRFALSDGESAAQSIKVLTCEKIMGDADMTAAFTSRMEKNKLTAAFSGTTLTITKDAKSVTVSCAPVPIGDFNLLEVKADFSAVEASIQPITQTYLEKSLYNLLPVSVAFFHDLGTFVIRVLADQNVEEEFEPVGIETPASE
jgi:hypothetical protein